jgi:trans-2,3-dihydro-3-hydroxyanthranilate isomerase
MSNTSSPRTLPYAVVDVFAERPFEGNQLAIFPDARGLTTEQMQTLARETNLAETTFILPGDPEQEQREGVRVRIFTTQEELPFAGHPSLGTASWLYWNHPTLRGAETLILQLNAGPVPIRFHPPEPGTHGVFATMRQNNAIFGQVHAPEEVARILNLPIEDLDPSLPIQTVSTGVPFWIVPIRSLEAIHRLAIPQAVAQPWLDSVGAKFFFCVAPADPASGVHFHNRMQFYNGEDPATGSASGCAIAWLVRHGVVPSGRPTLFEQGLEILRPSRIHVQATLSIEAKEDGKVLVISDVFVSGRTIPVASGHFFLP